MFGLGGVTELRNYPLNCLRIPKENQVTCNFCRSHFSPFSPISILTCLHRYRCKDLHSPIQQLHGYLLYDSSVIFSGETLLIRESEKQPPHKIDENLWKNREQIEEIIFLLETSNWPTSVCGYWEHFF